MAVVLTLAWPEITPDLYEAARTRVRWEEDVPPGLVTHTSWFVDDGLRVHDVWESEAQCMQFIADRITPVLKGELGVRSDPQATFSPLNRRFVAPGVSGVG